jgi:hypothetical protein
MGIDHHIHISACTHSSRYILKITTRKAYANFKTSDSLRSLNVKDSTREIEKAPLFVEHTFQPCTSRLCFPPPIYGADSRFEGYRSKYRGLFLKKHVVNQYRFEFCGHLNPVIQD